MHTLFDSLNKQQLEAVTHFKGPLLVLAGAGSGKTRILSLRIVWLIKEKNILPENILAITFTNKAAEEMKSRLAQYLGKKVHHLWTGTFHAICVRILRQDIQKLGGSDRFVIIDEKEQTSLIKEIMATENLPDFLTAGQIRDQISQLKNKSWEFLKGARGSVLADTRDFLPQVQQVFKKYQKILWRRQTLDFDDLIVYAINLLEKFPEILEQYQSRFKFILVDEYHDTNPLQYQLIKLLAKKEPNLFVVGDVDQNIYSWRGADIRNILEFEKDYPKITKTIRLEENYRSTQKILEAANHLIKQNRLRKEKNLWTNNEAGQPLGYYEADDSEDEAQFIARQIKETPEDSRAIFYRTHAQSRIIEEVLIKNSIPYQIVGGVRFYDRKEIKDLLGYLRLAVNKNDDFALARIINLPPRGAGKAALEKIKEAARQSGKFLWPTLLEMPRGALSFQAAKGVQKFIAVINKLTKLSEKGAAPEKIIKETLAKTDYFSIFKELPAEEAEEKKANIEELISVARGFENAGSENLLDFLSWVGLMGDDRLAEEESGKPPVILTTLHNAKGLEFNTVFITGLEEGLLPHQRNLDNSFFLEEERRLFYVGITRAKKKLFLSWSRARRLSGKQLFQTASRFLSEIPEHLIKNYGFQPQTPKIIYDDLAYSEVPIGHFKPGDMIEHQHWGQGEIKKIKPGQDLIFEVYFKKMGLKSLLAKYAPIKKVTNENRLS